LGGLSFTIVHVGKPKVSFVRSGIEHYVRKIKPYASVELKAVREEVLRKGLSLQEVRKKERERLRKAMDARATWVVLDEKGKQLVSSQFASLLEEWMVQGRSRLGFLVGGPNPSYNWDGCCPSSCGSVGNNALCGAAPLSPPAGQPDQKSYLQFNDSWPLNSWEVTENSNGYQAAYIRLLAHFVSP